MKREDKPVPTSDEIRHDFIKHVVTLKMVLEERELVSPNSGEGSNLEGGEETPLKSNIILVNWKEDKE